MQIIINPPSSPIAFEIFNLPVRWYGLVLTFSIFLGIFLVYRLFLSKKMTAEAEYFLDFTPYLVLFSIAGARIFYVFGQLDYYLLNPKEIIMINHGGISIYGAIIFGLLGLIAACKLKKINFFKTSDFIALVMPLCQSIGRWGNYFNQEAFGLPSDSFVKMFVEKQYRLAKYQNYEYFHPTFLYESLLDLFIFAILLVIFFKFKNIKNGTILFLYLVFYSLARIFVEFIRVDSVLNVFGIPVAVFISFLVLLSAFISLIVLYRLK